MDTLWTSPDLGFLSAGKKPTPTRSVSTPVVDEPAPPPPPPEELTPSDIVLNLPPQILRLVVAAGPAIRIGVRAMQVFAWEPSFAPISLLLWVSWLGICLIGRPFVQLAPYPVLLCALFVSWLRYVGGTKRHTEKTSSGEAIIQKSPAQETAEKDAPAQKSPEQSAGQEAAQKPSAQEVTSDQKTTRQETTGQKITSSKLDTPDTQPGPVRAIPETQSGDPVAVSAISATSGTESSGTADGRAANTDAVITSGSKRTGGANRAAPANRPSDLVAALNDADYLFAGALWFYARASHIPSALSWEKIYTAPGAYYRPAVKTLWFLVLTAPAYIALVYFVPLPLVAAVVGSLVLTWNAPWMRLLRFLVTRSALLRWAGRVVLAVLCGGYGLRAELALLFSGTGLLSVLFGYEPRVQRAAHAAEADAQLTDDVAPVSGELLPTTHKFHVRFVIFENQRWWVGLDWTQALLPGERAAWTDVDLNPSLPPACLVLPPASVKYQPARASDIARLDPTRSIKVPTNHRILLKISLRWVWLDPEWRVVHSRPPAFFKDAHTALSKIRHGIVDPYPPSLLKAPFDFDVYDVDADGWQYGDNHFDKLTPQSGIGRYTRRRAWTRRVTLAQVDSLVVVENKKNR